MGNNGNRNHRCAVSAEKETAMKRLALILCAFAALLVAANAGAQIQLARSVLGSGGGGGGGANNVITGTIGQVAIGVANGPDWMHDIGFWPGAPTPTAVDDHAGQPAVFKLQQNQPNPFNPVTTIHYAVPNAGHVAIRLYDTRGRLVRTLVDEDHQPGYFHFVFNGEGVASGIYLYRMEAPGFGETKKLVLLK